MSSAVKPYIFGWLSIDIWSWSVLSRSYKVQPGLELWAVWWLFDYCDAHQAVKIIPQMFHMNITVLSLPTRVLVHAGFSCQCQDRGLAWCCPQTAGRCPKAGRVIKLTVEFQVPVTDIFLSLEWWSLSCWSLKDEFKHISQQFPSMTNACCYMYL